ncbi:hypothetical protein BDV93DRAFT_565398 [Ceratobasidium sp. AG-I]|nr:hypothetical protein BDV93DRAFT_565398 [Ceratobasidium sp. AG-I]
MASHPPAGHQDTFRHRITNVKLDPPTSDYDITIKILVDGQEAHRLSPIKQGAPLSWDRMIPCDVRSGSLVEIRVYEKHLFSLKRVGTLEYDVSKVADQLEASFGETLGPTRDALKAILDFGQAVSELHPAAKIAFGICKIAWDTLEKQEQCDASVEKLVIGLAGMLPFVDQVDKAARLSLLRKTVGTMMNLIEDASRFVAEYKSDQGPVQGLRAVVGTKAQVQVQGLLDMFRSVKEDFDRGVGVQTLETVEGTHEIVDAVHKVLLTNTRHASLDRLNPPGSARYDSTRACHLGTRIGIIKEIVDWSQRRDGTETLLWVHGQAGLGKSSIATSVCQELDSKKLLACGFFCKRDSSERRDPQQVLAAIVYGLASRHSEYAHAVACAIQRDSQLCNSPIQMQYDSLVGAPLEASSQVSLSANLVVIIDA